MLHVRCKQSSHACAELLMGTERGVHQAHTATLNSDAGLREIKGITSSGRTKGTVKRSFSPYASIVESPGAPR